MKRINNLLELLERCANVMPEKHNLLQNGKQVAYSHIYFELRRIIDSDKVGYINWKVMNLIIGFVAGTFWVYILSCL